MALCGRCGGAGTLKYYGRASRAMKCDKCKGSGEVLPQVVSSGERAEKLDVDEYYKSPMPAFNYLDEIEGDARNEDHDDYN